MCILRANPETTVFLYRRDPRERLQAKYGAVIIGQLPPQFLICYRIDIFKTVYAIKWGTAYFGVGLKSHGDSRFF